MIPIVCFVGRSGVGKTTLVEKVIQELVKRGRRIAAFKHAHAGFQSGPKGKDSERLSAAGANQVVVIAPNKYSLITTQSGDPSLSELFPLILDCEFAIAEGFKDSPYPKVEVYRNQSSLMLPEESLAAVVTDKRLNVSVPQFRFEDISVLTDWVEAQCTITDPQVRVNLTVNGERVSLNPFANKMLGQTMLGAVSALRGAEEPHTIKLSVRQYPSIP